MTDYTPPAEAVEVVRLALHQTLAPVWMSVANALGGDQGQYDEMLRDLATAALTAAGPVIAAEVERLRETNQELIETHNDYLLYVARVMHERDDARQQVADLRAGIE